MGVPKFFRYISERYPCLSEVIKEHQIPEFDHLYLDMNGIFHVCSHPNDNDTHFRISEEMIFKGIFQYLEVLFRLIRPKKLFFMAVDGVAPRAKMNQQRGRRFRSAKESELLEKKALARGEKLPEEKRFDSNCITPGTEFMTKLDQQLNYFVSYKISTDKLWQKPRIILSGHQVPGEGEHKVMNYIRWMRSQKDWDPNTRHCLYGLDADLIMLGLCTHEPNFCLLREEVKFGRKSQRRIPTPEETTFLLFHLSLLRDYLDLEFQELKVTLPFDYDLERIIDDWVLMCFLVGNDFIPNLPGLNIADGALQLLYKTYTSVLPSLGGYINDGGTLNLGRFERYLSKLSEYDLDQFREIQADIKYFDSKTGRKILQEGSDQTDTCMIDFRSDTMNEELQDLIKSTNMELENGEALEDSGEESDEDTSKDEDEEEELLRAEFSLFKKDYYINKLKYRQVTPEILTSQADGYVQAIQWNLHYYYNGCPSWSWYYPHHYSPYISDIKGFADLKLDFELGLPFLPFQQLLAVLPAASKDFLPSSLQKLMTSTESPIIDFYPNDFDIDMNGKKQEWEGVVLIPFIDQAALLSAMEPCYTNFTNEERKRNMHGPMYIYKYTPEDLGSRKAPEYFPEIESNHAHAEEVWSAQIIIKPKSLIKGLHPRYKEIYCRGFPTLSRIPFKAELRKEKVKVFEQPSRGENMILAVTKSDSRDLNDIANELVGKVVYVGWPHLSKAMVTHISSPRESYIFNSEYNKPVLSILPSSEVATWNLLKTSIVTRHRTNMGIDLGPIKVIVFASLMKGVKIKFTSDSMPYYDIVWADSPDGFPLQTVICDIGETTEEDVPNVSESVVADTEGERKENGSKILPHPKRMRLEDVFLPGATCFMLAPPFYGAMGEIIDCKKGDRVKTHLFMRPKPDISSVQLVSKKKYMTGYRAAVSIGISPHLLSRITGTIFIQSANTESDKTNIGLNLKFNKKNEFLLGFTRKENNQWLYSEDAVNLVWEYLERFPELFVYLNKYAGDDIYFLEDVFKTDGKEKLKAIASWVKEQSCSTAERRHIGSEMLEGPAVLELERIVSSHNNPLVRQVTVQVRPHLLYLPKPHFDTVGPDPSTKHSLLDRIVSIRECHTIPLGLKGTIIGIEKKDDEASTIYDILFDETFVGGLKLGGCQDTRCYRLTGHGFINLTVNQTTPTHSSKYQQQQDTDKQQNKPKQEQWTAPNNSEGRVTGMPLTSHSSDMDSGVRNNSAFANWRNKDASSSIEQNTRQQQVEQEPTPVSAFFKAYNQNSRKEVVSGSSAKPTQPQPPPLVPQAFLQKPTADVEFQDMWNVLQQNQNLDPPKLTPKPQQPPKNSAPTQESDSAAVSQQTDALKKLLKLDKNATPCLRPDAPMQPPPKKTCGHTNCLRSLITLCQKIGIAYPVYDYSLNPATNMTTTTVRFPGLAREFIGTPEKEKSAAAENAACVAAQLLTQPRMVGGTVHHLSLHQPMAPPFFQQPPPPGFNQQPPSLRSCNMNQNLPTPPQQWYKHNKLDGNQIRLKTREPNQPRPGNQPPSNSNRGVSGNSSVSQFVPLQVQKGGGNIGKANQGTSGKAGVQPTTRGPASGQQCKNNNSQQLGSSNPNSPLKKANQEKKLQPPAKNRPDVGVGGGTPPTKPQQQQGAGMLKKGKLRPRIAAKFPVPLDTA